MQRNPNEIVHDDNKSNNSRNPNCINSRRQQAEDRMIIINPINAAAFGGEYGQKQGSKRTTNSMQQNHVNTRQQQQQKVDASLFESQKIQKQEYQYLTTKTMAGEVGPSLVGHEPGPTDVICARGKRALNHEGNRRFRQLVEDRMEDYSQASTKLEKSLLVSQIIDCVRQTQPPGGFLRESCDYNKEQCWYEVGDAVAREKVGQG